MQTGRINNDNRNQTLNKRIYERNIPSQVINQSLDPRSVQTRQVLYPALHTFKQSPYPILSNEGYNQGAQFNPGTSAPYGGYASFVDLETRLHNSFAPVQKYNVNNKFIPSSQSDLYKETVQEDMMKTPMQPYPSLFQEPHLPQCNKNPRNLGKMAFNNHTRQQVKDLK